MDCEILLTFFLAGSPLQAGLLALKHGLQASNNLHLLPLEIETDSREAIKLLSDYNSIRTCLTNEWRMLMLQARHPVVRHNFWGGQWVAHLLAKETLKNSKINKPMFFACPSTFVESNIIKECEGLHLLVKHLSYASLFRELKYPKWHYYIGKYFTLVLIYKIYLVFSKKI